MRTFVEVVAALMIGVLFFVGGIAAARATPRPTMTAPFGAPSGRYYAIPFQNTSVIVIDTQTGQCWDSTWKGWHDMGTPAP